MVYGINEHDPNNCEFKYWDETYEINFCKKIGLCKYKAPFSKTIHVGTELIQISGKCEPPKTE